MTFDQEASPGFEAIVAASRLSLGLWKGQWLANSRALRPTASDGSYLSHHSPSASAFTRKGPGRDEPRS